MIYLFSGTPGSGKSLHMARAIWRRLQAGKPVVANFGCKVDAIRRKHVDFLQVDNSVLSNGPLVLEEHACGYWKQHGQVKEGAIWWFCDEAQLLFNARSWSARGREDWIRFFSQHRKLGYDIFLVAQYDLMLDKQIRSLIEYQYIHRKVANFGIAGRLLSLVAGGGLFCVVKQWYPMQQRVGSEFFRYRRKYGRFFDTYNVF